MTTTVIDRLPRALGPIELAYVELSEGARQVLVWNGRARQGSLHKNCDEAYREALRQFFNLCEGNAVGRKQG